MDTETHYTNIERELLVIVYGCEKFHTYLYGRTFIMETDHKPPRDDQPEKSHSGPCMTPENAPPSAAVWPDHNVQTRQGNASGGCPQPSSIQNQHQDQVRPTSRCHINLRILPKTSHQDSSKDAMGPHPLNGAPTHPERLAWQTRSCPQSSQILLELLRRALHRRRPPHQGWTSGHSTILQRQYPHRPPWKPCRHQQGNGPGQNVGLLARHGSRCHRQLQLHQAVLDMHRKQQPTSRDAAPPRGPSRTLGKNRCWLLSRPFGKKASNSGRLLQ